MGWKREGIRTARPNVQERVNIYAGAVRQLDLIGSSPLLARLDGLPGLIERFQGVRTIHTTAFRIERKKALEDRMSLYICQAVTYPCTRNSPEPVLPTVSDLALPETWTISLYFRITIDTHGSPLFRPIRPTWFPTLTGPVPSPTEVRLPACLGPTVIEIRLEGEYFPRGEITRLVHLRAIAGYPGLRVLECPASAAWKEDISALAQFVGDTLETLSIGGPALRATDSPTLREVIDSADWSGFSRLKDLKIAAFLQDWEGNVDEWTDLLPSPPPPLLQPKLSRPLNLNSFELYVMPQSIEGNSVCRWSFWDSLPSMYELARVLLSIGGPDCKYTLDPCVEEGADDLQEWEYVKSVANMLLSREIGAIIGKPSSARIMDPRMLDPDWDPM